MRHWVISVFLPPGGVMVLGSDPSTAATEALRTELTRLRESATRLADALRTAELPESDAQSLTAKIGALCAELHRLTGMAAVHCGTSTTADLIGSLSPAARLAIYQATRGIAMADQDVDQEEHEALKAVAAALHIEGIPPTTDFRGLSQHERELAYACAAWLARADAVTADAETRLLGDLRTTLQVDEDAAAALHTTVDALRAEAHPGRPWRQEFTALLAGLLP
jgi:Tellurite resistance protein TerB